jgi:hypothetical protein
MKRFLTNDEKRDYVHKLIKTGNLYTRESKSFLDSLGEYKFANTIYLLLRNKISIDLVGKIIFNILEKRIDIPVCMLDLSNRKERGFANNFYYPRGKDDVECKERLIKLLKKRSGYEISFDTNGYIDHYCSLSKKNNTGVYLRDSRINWSALNIHSTYTINFRKRNFMFIDKSAIFRAYHTKKIPNISKNIERALSVRLDKEKVRNNFLRFINSNKRFTEITSSLYGKKKIALMIENEDQNDKILSNLLDSSNFETLEAIRKKIYSDVLVK